MRQTRPAPPPQPRRDGWTPARQLAFLAALAETRSVSRAAEVAGMGREGAHRLRNRRDGALFAAIWDLALAPDPRIDESHIESLGDGRLMRLLGNHFRRKSGDFLRPGRPAAESHDSRRT